MSVRCLASFWSPQTPLLDTYCSLHQDDCLAFVSLFLPPYQRENRTKGMEKVLKYEAVGLAEGWALWSLWSVGSERLENTECKHCLAINSEL